jgi:hypothetical protein
LGEAETQVSGLLFEGQTAHALAVVALASNALIVEPAPHPEAHEGFTGGGSSGHWLYLAASCGP